MAESGSYRRSSIPNLRPDDSISAFDVSPSGDTFLIAETRAGEGDGDIHVILQAQ